jgi:hypothetical protein
LSPWRASGIPSPKDRIDTFDKTEEITSVRERRWIGDYLLPIAFFGCMDHRNWLGQLAPDRLVILTKIVTAMADFDGLSDHFILRMYEFIRHEVLSDASAGTRLAGLAARQRADGLLKEIDRRGLICKPIDWP